MARQGGNFHPTTEQARAMQRKSAAARRKNTEWRKSFQGAIKAYLEGTLKTGETGAEDLVMRLVAQARDGSVPAARLLYDMSGEEKKRIEVSGAGEQIPEGLAEIYQLIGVQK